MKKIILIFLILFNLFDLIGQEITNIELEFEHPYSDYPYLRIEIYKKGDDYQVYKSIFKKNDLLLFIKKDTSKRESLIAQEKNIIELEKMIQDFETLNSENEFLIDGIQDSRNFKLNYKTDKETKVLKSSIGQEFKTDNYDLKKFNEICVKILKIAKMNPNKTIK